MQRQLTVRALIVGILGLLVITASSMYVALRMGALPWPTVFVTVVSMATLRKRNGATLQEINVTHTLMSAGAMVAGGLAFTIPGLWMLDPSATMPTISMMILAVAGAVLGTLFTTLFRKDLIEREQLPYPMGQAAYNTLIAGTSGGGAAKKLFSAMGGSVAFTVVRDGFRWIPSVVVPFKGTAMFPAFSMWVSPMALGIGAIIGPALSLIWLGGAVFGYYLLTPVGLASGLFSDMAAADAFRSNLGIGLMVGTGLGVAIKAIWGQARRYTQNRKHPVDVPRRRLSPKARYGAIALIAATAILLAVGTDITLGQTLVVIAGIYLTTYLSGMLTGQTGVNPMEIFGILVLLVIQLFWHPGFGVAFSVAAVTAVACGLTGDVMNDLKSGHMLGTDPRQQLVAEGIGGVIGAIVSVVVLLIMKDAFGGFGTAELPAPQAAAVSAMAGGLQHVPAFLIGAAIGMTFYLLSVPAATLGLGIYLPIYISSAMGLGAISMLIVRALTRKADQTKITADSNLVASGLLGGEGITGVAIAIISML
ncbi:MAG: OPT/YSL family transporter [Sphaerochaetaceae bacterium]|jgi:uncharacterized oligopeptide transporter (OPT) family protein